MQSLIRLHVRSHFFAIFVLDIVPRRISKRIGDYSIRIEKTLIVLNELADSGDIRSILINVFSVLVLQGNSAITFESYPNLSPHTGNFIDG